MDDFDVVCAGDLGIVGSGASLGGGASDGAGAAFGEEIRGYDYG
jgi:hypothetical protein